ncbi:FK506 binding protein proline rotamase rapamycin-binding protein [Paraphaeosphaeria minitans]
MSSFIKSLQRTSSSNLARAFHPRTNTSLFHSSARTMGVTKTTITEGNGPSPNKGDQVTMLYTGWLKNADGSKGKEFDSTQKPGRGPFKTAIGVGRVIRGWDEGVPQMKLGEKATLDITSDYAYGDQEFPGLIPKNSNLVFEVELQKIN